MAQDVMCRGDGEKERRGWEGESGEGEVLITRLFLKLPGRYGICSVFAVNWK